MMGNLYSAVRHWRVKCIAPGRLCWFVVFIALAVLCSSAAGQDGRAGNKAAIESSGDGVVAVEANPAKGFNFPYYLFVPEQVDRSGEVYLYVEPNNTGKASDELEVHREKALKLATSSYPNRIARELKTPLLVPVFPRPGSDLRAYTHALDIDTLKITEGELKRIDLQLLAMIDDAIEMLREDGYDVQDRVFMHGFSASAKFCNRFAYLHPERVKAVAAGGVNGLPTLPIRERDGHTLPFPIGIAGIEAFTDGQFDAAAHLQVPQYIYMGYMDRNDTLPSRDAWNEDEAAVIRDAIAENMMPERWEISQAIYREHLPCAQCVTYNGVTHTIKPEMLEDIVTFFKANSGKKYVAIEPHQYPFVEYKQIREAHVNALYWPGDPRLPAFVNKGSRHDKFMIGIEEWMPGQSHRQLGEFVKNAGYRFRLKSEGRPDILITKDNFGGTASVGDGSFQVFYVNLDKEQQKAIVSDEPYTLHPEGGNDEYVWIVKDGVELIVSKR